MNTNLISKYLQFLRRSRHYTQEELAEKLGISRQAVSKWETGCTIPDIEILLKISRLYGITINDILEPEVWPRRINDFEQISMIPAKELKEALMQFDDRLIVTALMGASPDINYLCEGMFPEFDFEKTRNQIGRVRIEEVESAQKKIVSMVNLLVSEVSKETLDTGRQ